MHDNTSSDSSLSLPAVDPAHLQSNQSTNITDGSAAPAQPTSSMPQPAPTSSAQQTPPAAVAAATDTPSQSNLIAEDVDLIEKEWVERAKDIVHKTKDNPYLQNQALTQMKVDYIKKRYDKNVQMSE